MCNDRITSINNLSVISSLIEHTHIKTKNISKVNSTSHTTFIRADNHHMLAVDVKVVHIKKEILDKLVCAWYRFKSLKRNSIVYSRVMCIESNNILNAHICKFLKHKCTVKRFSSCSLVLSWFIKERHDYINSSCLTTCSSNNSLEVSIVIIRRHMVLETANSIFKAVVADIKHNI